MALSAAAKDLMNLSRNGSYSMARDALKHRLWDSYSIPAAVAGVDHTYFVQHIGTAFRVGNKTLNETNMYDSGKLPNGQVMVFTRMGICAISNNDHDGVNSELLAQAFYLVLQNSVFEVKLQGREWDYQIHGSEFLPRPIGIAGSGTLDAATTPYRVGDMIASGYSSLLPTPIVLDQLVSFQVLQRMGSCEGAVNTKIDAASAVLLAEYSTIQVTLEGLLTRAK